MIHIGDESAHPMLRRMLAACLAAALLVALVPVSATAAGTSTLMGRVRNLQGNAVNNVRVLLYQRFGGVETLVGEALTENGGQFQFFNLLAATYGLKVVDDSGTYAPAWYGSSVTLGIGELRQGIEFTVSRAGSISGVVSNSAALPLSGVIVNAYPRSPEGPFDEYAAASTVTGADGGYTLAGMSAGTYAVQFFSTYPEYPSQFYGMSSALEAAEPVTLAEASTVNGIGATLRRWGGITGSVTATGAGVPNAIVRCYRRDGATWTLQSAAVTLTKDPDTVEPGQVVGSFAADRLYPGTYRVAIETTDLPTARPVQFYGGASGPSTDIRFAADVEVVEDMVSTGIGVDFTDDRLPPTTSLSPLPAGWPRSVTITLTAADGAGGSGVGATYYWFDSGAPTVYTGPFTYGTDGGHTLSWYSVDRFGNPENVRTADVLVDGLFPVTSSDAVSEYTGSARVQLIAADNRTGVAATYYSLDGGDAVAGTSVASSRWGIHSLRYWSVDGAGNVEPAHTDSFFIYSSGGSGGGGGGWIPGGSGTPTSTVDTTPPVTTIIGVPAGWSTSDVEVSFVATDDTSDIGAVYYRLGGGSATTYTAPVVVTAEGVTTIDYWAVDARNNRETSRSSVIRIDRTAPVSAANVSEFYLDSARISIVVSDSVSGLSAIRRSLDGAPSTGSIIDVSEPGTHTLEWSAVDVAGNVETTHSASFTVTRGTRTTPSARALYPAYGAWATLSGALADSAGTPLPGRVVHLETYSGGAWVESASNTITGPNGTWSFSVRPSSLTRYRAAFFGSVGYLPSSATETVVAPKVYLTAPYAPTRVVRGRGYTVYGYLRPKHTARAYSVRVQCYRLENRRWVLRKTVWARNADYGSSTRYSAVVALPYAGSWRLRAYHADSGHAATYSSYRYVSAR